MRHRASKRATHLNQFDGATPAQQAQQVQRQAARRTSALVAILSALAATTVVGVVGTSMAAPSTTVNLIGNAGFEKGMTGWTASPSAVAQRGSARTGSYDANLAAASNARTAKVTSSAANSVLTARPAGTTSAKASYHGAVWVAASGGPVTAVLRVRELKGTVVVGQRLTVLSLTGKAWHRLTVSYTAAKSGDALAFSVIARSLPAGRSLRIDDASLTVTDPTVTPTPTPSDTPTTTPTPTPTPTPPPASGPALIGVSMGGDSAATQAQFPNMKVARFFYPGAPSTWGGGIASIPANQTIIVSFNYDPATTAAGGSDAAFTQVLRSWAASGRQIYWNWQHEADNPSNTFSQATYRAGWEHLLADAAAVHASNLHSMSILMAIALTGVHGSVEGWYVPGVDVVGFDCYYLDNEPLAEQYALAKGKPLAFPEFGDAIGGSPDAASAVFARQFIAGLDDNTIAASWYNNNGNDIATHPQTLAVLRAAAGS